jgi:hypothetical protein
VRPVTVVQFDREELDLLRRMKPDMVLALGETDEINVKVLSHLTTSNETLTWTVLSRALEGAAAAYNRAVKESDPDFLLDLWQVPQGREDEETNGIITGTPRNMAKHVAEVRRRQADILAEGLKIIRAAARLATPPADEDA